MIYNKFTYLPRISIITTNYNQGDFLEETIKSVLNQGYPNLEYIIIDGGSDDNSVQIIKKYSSHLSHWVSEKDNGQSNAINKGLNFATGEIIGFINSDDFYYENCFLSLLENIYDKLDKFWVFSGAISFVDKNSKVKSYSYPFINFNTPVDLTLQEPELWHLPQPGSFYSRSSLLKAGAWVREDLKYTMDRDLFYRLVLYSKVIISKNVIASYRFHESSKTTQFMLDSYLELKRVYFYCNWGGMADKIKRKIILRKRLGIGYSKAVGLNYGLFSLKYFMLAIFYDLKYLTEFNLFKKMIKRLFYIKS